MSKVVYRPAYRYGVNAYDRFGGRSFNEVEPQLSRDWDKYRGLSTLDWEKARPAARDAYERVGSSKL